jgi:hypothetical protein
VVVVLSRSLLSLVILLGFACPAARAAEPVIAGLSTVLTQLSPTWNAGAPKLASDGLFTYAALIGFNGDQYVWSIVRKRGTEPGWQQGGVAIRSLQPPVMLVDRKGRLNLFFNEPALRHIRFDQPAVDLQAYVDIPVGYPGPTAYLHASYDARSDVMLVAFNDPTDYTLYVTSRYTDGNAWTPASPLPSPGTDGIYSYARVLRADGRYYVVASEHPRGTVNASYRAIVLWESASPLGPWNWRTIHRSVGINIGVPYKNWVFHADMQADPVGRIRILFNLNESDAGHDPWPRGFYVARSEDGYRPTLVAGSYVENGVTWEPRRAFALYVDPDGPMLAIGRISKDAPGTPTGRIVAYRSDDAGARWSAPITLATDHGTDAVVLDARNGSLLPAAHASFLYTWPGLPPHDSVQYTTLPLGLAPTAWRSEGWDDRPDGTRVFVRAFTEHGSGRSHFFTYTHAADGTWRLDAKYSAGDFYRVYEARSNGSYRSYDSDGFLVAYEAPESRGRWVVDQDGSRDYVHFFADPANGVDWWYLYDYDTAGNWTFVWVFRQPGYWLIEHRTSSGSLLRYDSRGYRESR